MPQKGMLFVGIYSLVLIVLFVLFVYLMTTVNPVPTHSSSTTTTTTPVLRVQTVILRIGTETTPKILFPTTRVNPDDVVLNEIPPGTRTPVESTQNNAERLQNTSRLTQENGKGQKRKVRDSNSDRNDDSKESIILKVLNAKGQTRIEIKLDSDIFAKKKPRNFQTFNKKQSGLLNVILANKSNILRQKLPMKTIIQILPDDTVIIGDHDEAYLSYEYVPTANTVKLNQNTAVLESTENLNETLTTKANTHANDTQENIAKFQLPNNNQTYEVMITSNNYTNTSNNQVYNKTNLVVGLVSSENSTDFYMKPDPEEIFNQLKAILMTSTPDNDNYTDINDIDLDDQIVSTTICPEQNVNGTKDAIFATKVANCVTWLDEDFDTDALNFTNTNSTETEFTITPTLPLEETNTMDSVVLEVIPVDSLVTNVDGT